VLQVVVDTMVAASLLLNLVVILLLLTRNFSKNLQTMISPLEKGLERIEKALREEMLQGRDESNRSAKLMREEMGNTFKSLSDTLLVSVSDELGNSKRR